MMWLRTLLNLWKQKQHSDLISTGNSSAPSKYLLYLTLEELPLYIFRQCIEKGELNGLIIQGQPPVEVVAEVWANLYADYIDLSGETDAMYVIQLQKEISLLSYKVSSTGQTLQILEDRAYSEEQLPKLIRIIKGQGFILENKEYTQDGWDMALQRIKNRLAPVKMQLIKAENELNAWVKNREASTTQENYFLVMLVRLQKYGYRDFNTANKTLSVAEFVMAIKDYLQYVNEHNKSLEYGKEGRNQ